MIPTTIDENVAEEGPVDSTSFEAEQVQDVRRRKGKEVSSDVGLSFVSQQYDRNGKGYLDPTESMLRQLDTENRGHLDVNKVYDLMVALQTEQKKAMNLKRLVIVLAAFSLLLALSNIGTSFAAAILAKDLSVSDGSNDLNVRASGQRAGTTPKTDIFNFDKAFGDIPSQNNGTRMLQTDYDFYFTHDYLGFQKSASDIVTMHKALCNQFSMVEYMNWDGDPNYFDCTSGSTSIKIAYCGLVKSVEFHQKPVYNTATKDMTISFKVVGSTTVYSFVCNQNTFLCTAPTNMRTECLNQQLVLGTISVYDLRDYTPALEVQELMLDICELYPGFSTDSEASNFNCTYDYPGYNIAFPKTAMATICGQFKTLTLDSLPQYDADTYTTTLFFRDNYVATNKYQFQCHITGTLYSGLDCYSPEIDTLC